MAEFCNFCCKHVFGDVEPDIDVNKIFEGLKPGYFIQTLCEGCGLLAIVKKENGEMKVIYSDNIEEEVDYYDKKMLDR